MNNESQLELLSVDEVAAIEGVAISTVTRWCRDGVIPHAFKMGGGRRGVWVIPKSALKEFERPIPGPKMGK